jgi:hypothetical protein
MFLEVPGMYVYVENNGPLDPEAQFETTQHKKNVQC